MEFVFPYRFIVDSQKQASYMLDNMCDNCSRFYICGSEESKRCDEIKQMIATAYAVTNGYKEAYA